MKSPRRDLCNTKRLLWVQSHMSCMQVSMIPTISMITDIPHRGAPTATRFQQHRRYHNSVKDKELDDLAALGVCGIHIAKRYGAYPKENFLRQVDRANARGWRVPLRE